MKYKVFLCIYFDKFETQAEGFSSATVKDSALTFFDRGVMQRFYSLVKSLVEGFGFFYFRDCHSHLASLHFSYQTWLLFI
jgi:hypothetical protein